MQEKNMFDHYEYLHMKVLINFMGDRKKNNYWVVV